MANVVVTLPKGDDSSGMAVMFADYLESNFRDFPSKQKIVRRLRNPIVLRANDRDVAITLRFARGLVSVEDGAAEGAPEIAGPFFVLTKVASSQSIPPEDLKKLEMTGMKKHPLHIALCAALLRTPSSFYREA